MSQTSPTEIPDQVPGQALDQALDLTPIQTPDPTPSRRRHQVVIIGSGFGGLFAAKALKRDDVDITIISATSSHLFQPLLYQVATGILSTGEIAPATREILKRQRNARVILGTVTRIDLTERTVHAEALGETFDTAYDTLIVAAGAGQSYFGSDEFATYAPGMKTIDDALEVRGRIFTAFELAEVTTDPAKRAALTTFVVVGAGPTGVEMAGQISEMAHRTLRHEFRSLDPTTSRIVLLDGADRVLGSFGHDLSAAATRTLEGLQVEVRLGTKVVGVDAEGVDIELPDGSRDRIESVVKIWAAGVAASPLGAQLAAQSGAELDRAGRVRVTRDLTLPGHPEVFVVGDMMALDGLPGVAQVAIQGGRYAASRVRDRVAGRLGLEAAGTAAQGFTYRDKGSMATVSRFSAIASIGRAQFTGFIAWLMWLFIHLLYITGFKNRTTTLIHWFASFIGRGRTQRATTERLTVGRLAVEQLGADFHPTLGGDVVFTGDDAGSAARSGNAATSSGDAASAESGERLPHA